jgi:ribonuclease P/MRP protein subunit RPP40
MCNGNQGDVAVMDFSKSFDVVPHQRLLRKLDYYGIRGAPLKWIQDFLSGRTQQVVVDGMFSEIAPVTSGVPQGSVLGPILFLTFINDMPEAVKSNCKLFADDSIVYRACNSLADSTDLQKDLESLERWEENWCMKFNPSKCNIIHVGRKKKGMKEPYRLKETVLETVNTATYLGIEIAKDLSWHHQVHKVVSKGNRALGFIKRNIKTSYQIVKERAYNTMVRPTMEYASSVWSQHPKEVIKSHLNSSA